MKQIELFAGIGGFGLAGEWAGIETVAQVEINDFCQKVLAKNFQNAQRFGDIKQFRGSIDIISGGFPCQPYSTAGKRLGKDDERHLWPEMLRVIREVAPRWVVGENVRGIVSWNGGMVFDEVQSDLEAEGYEVQAFILPAVGVNAPHRRERVWFIAHAAQNSRNNGTRNAGSFARKIPCERSNELVSTTNTAGVRFNRDDWERQKREQCGNGRKAQYIIDGNGCETSFTNTNEKRREQHIIPVEPGSTGLGCGRNNENGAGFEGFPSQSPICGGDDGFSAELDKNRGNRIAALGNAIVPQVAFEIFRAIIEYENISS